MYGDSVVFWYILVTKLILTQCDENVTKKITNIFPASGKRKLFYRND